MAKAKYFAQGKRGETKQQILKVNKTTNDQSCKTLPSSTWKEKRDKKEEAKSLNANN